MRSTETQKALATRNLLDLIRTDGDIMREIALEFSESAQEQEDYATTTYYQLLAEAVYKLVDAGEFRSNRRVTR